ncbi:MAG: transglycosylase domain-containing protein [Candidatus Pristimantibacillus sp.]
MKKITVKRTLWGISALIGVTMLGGLITFHSLVAAQDISQLDIPLPAATIIFDLNGEEATRLELNDIDEIAYSEIPSHMVNAIVAVEDKRYFEHKGMDLRAVGRAFITNLTSGGTVQGGSTITQQLAKNVFLSHERTWTRKWNEVLLAKKIEDHYSKTDIITMYLNQIYYGEGAWGIQRASQTYFGKNASELTIAESALLAGLVKAPSTLTPYKNPDKAKERRNVVLQLMKEQGVITDDVYNEAIVEPISILQTKPNRMDKLRYPYYVDQIIREATVKYGFTDNEVLHGGLHIYTALDIEMQQAAEKVYEDESKFPDSSNDQLIQSGAVLVDPRDGGIRALVGGRGDQPFRGFNYAVQLKRQPGSIMKPIAVYTPALEQGYDPTDKLVDEPVSFGSYSPRNAGGAYHGEVSLYEALIHSYNIPAVKLLNEIGIDKGMEASARFGIPLVEGDRVLGLALGGLQEGVSPLQMAEAYGAFANDGVRMEAHAVTRIESADGTVLVELKGTEGQQATSSETARTMTAMLEGVIQDGTGQAAQLEGRALAGKSGTTEMDGTNGAGAKDNWFVGYTPQLVGAVWLGYDKSDSNHYLTTSSKAAAVVFQALMTEALKDEPIMKFPAAPISSMKKPDQGDKSNNKNNNKDNNKKKENKKDKNSDEKRDKDKKEHKWEGKEKDKGQDRDRDRDRQEEDGENND